MQHDLCSKRLHKLISQTRTQYDLCWGCYNFYDQSILRLAICSGANPNVCGIPQLFNKFTDRGPHDMRGIINSSATTSVCKICSTGTLSISHTKLPKFIAIVDLISSYSELHNMLSFKWMVMYKDHFDNNVTNNFAFSHYNNDICKNSQPKQSKDTSCSVTFKYVIHVVMLSISFHYSCSGREITRRKSEKL